MSVQRNTLVIEIDTTNAARNARLISKELESIERNGTYASKSMDSASVAIRQLAGTMAGLVTVSAAINKIDTYTNLNNQLKLVTNSQEELNTALSDTFAIAQRSAASWEAVNSVYAKYMSNAQTLNLSQEKSAKLTEVTAKAVALSGSTAEAAAGALFQYGQALDGNILRAEEFNSLVDGAGGLLNAMAMGLGVTRGELRQMMLDGKLTGEVMTEALLKAGDSVDELFNKTDVTIGQSLTMLSDAITKFTGEAASGSGAATILADSIGVLAKNLDLVADVAVVGGVAMLTKTIVTQTIATYGSIAASVAKRNSLLSELEAQATLTATEARRTASIAQYTQMQLADAKATAARMTGIKRLAYVQATVIPLEAKATQATAAHTAATNADTLAQEINNKARSRATMLLGMVGGPIGAITLGVTALSAGYLLFADRTAKANAKLEEQAAVANKASEELQKLEGHQRSAAKDDLAASFKLQNDELGRLHTQIGNTVSEITRLQSHNAELSKILVGVRAGTISYDEALKVLNNTKGATPDIIKKLTDEIAKYEEQRAKVQQNADAQKTLGVEVRLAGNAAQNTVSQHTAQANAIDKVAIAAAGASKELQDYRKQLRDKDLSNLYEAAYLDQGYSPEQAKALVEAQKAIGIDSGILSQDQINNALKSVQIAERRNQLEDKYNQKVKTSNKSQKESKNSEDHRLREQQQIISSYSDDFKKFRINYLQEVERIKNVKFGDGEAELLKKAEQRYLFEEDMFLRQITEEINAHKWSEEEKLNHYYDSQRLIAEESGKYNDELKKLKIDSLDDQQAHELALIKLAQETRIFYMKQALMTESEAIREQYRLEMEELAQIGDEKERQALRSAKSAQFVQGGIQVVDQSYEINRKGKSNVELLEAETGRELALLEQRFQAAQQAHRDNANELLEIERTYIEAKEQLHKQHDVALVDAREADHNNQMQFYGQMLSSAGAVWGDMTQMIKDAKGENSKTFKAMFIAQRTMAIAQQIINTELAAGATTAQTGIFGLPAAQVIRGIGYASVGLIAAQTLAGFSGGGFTGYGGKYEPAGIVHKGEGVLNQEEIRAIGGEAGFNQLRQAIKSGYSTGGLVKDNQRVGSRVVNSIQQPISTSKAESISIQNHITIASDGNATTHSDSKQLGEMINQAVIAVIRREQRQGGLLAK